MANLVWIGLLFVVAFKPSGGKPLIADDGEDLKYDAWIPYDSSRTKYPQCCGDSEACSMVRLSEKMIEKAMFSDNMRLDFEDTVGEIEMTLSFNEDLVGLTGEVFTDGQRYLLEPTTLEERQVKPCLATNFERKQHMFHKLIRLGPSKGALPPPLFSLLRTPSFSPCCQDSDICLPATLHPSVLTNAMEEVTVPWKGGLPPPDNSERFVLTLTMPETCKGLCDAYYYSNAETEVLKVIKDGEGVTVIMEKEGKLYNLVKCDDEYVWTIRTVEAKGLDIEADEEEVRYEDLPGSEDSTSITNREAISPPSGLSRAAPGPSCWYPNYYCDIQHYEVGQTTKAEGNSSDAQHMSCYNACKNNAECKHFTVFEVRGEPFCYLHSDCLKISGSACQESSPPSCVSGPSDCTTTTPPTQNNCTAPSVLDTMYEPWQCVRTGVGYLERRDFSLYDNTMPVGTFCVLRCESWITHLGTPGYLESQCQADGTWTTTAANDGNSTLAFPLAPYPQPDGGSTNALVCACPALDVVWPASDPAGYYYDPNTEKGMKFICDELVDTSGDQYVIEPSNRCRMFCDNYLFATFECENGRWSGNPTQGIWCYLYPEPIKVCNNTTPNSGPTLSMSSTGLWHYNPSATVEASNCNDGEYKNNICRSEQENNPWLSLTFSRPLYIYKVSVVNLLDCIEKSDTSLCDSSVDHDHVKWRKKFTKAVVRVGSTPPTADNSIITSGEKLGVKFTGINLGWGSTHDFVDAINNKPLWGSVVTMQLEKNNAEIMLSEVIVHYWAGPDLKGQTMSSVEGVSVASRCTDGKFTQVCHTKTENNPWLSLEYEAPGAWIEKVSVINRVSCGGVEPLCSGRFKDAVAIVGEVAPTNNNQLFTDGTQLGEKFTSNDLGAGETHDFVGAEPIWGTRVTIQLQTNTILNLAEVVVHFWKGCATIYEEVGLEGNYLELMPGDEISCPKYEGWVDPSTSHSHSVRVNTGCKLTTWAGMHFTHPEATFTNGTSTIGPNIKLGSLKCSCSF